MKTRSATALASAALVLTLTASARPAAAEEETLRVCLNENTPPYSFHEGKEAGGFDLQLNGGEDWDLSRRVARGRRLPRTRSIIHHDEGRTRLRTVYTKRRYYAPGYLAFLRKHGRGAVAQGNPLLRAAYVRNWRTLGRHPLLTAGMFTLKAVELAAVVDVAVDTKLRGRTRDRSNEVYEVTNVTDPVRKSGTGRLRTRRR